MMMYRSGLCVIAGLSGLALGGVVDADDVIHTSGQTGNGTGLPSLTFDISGLGSFAEMGSMLNEVVGYDFEAKGSSVHI